MPKTIPMKNTHRPQLKTVKYLNGKNNRNLTLSDDDLKLVKCYVDARFVVHPDLKSHTRAILTMRHAAMQSVSRKQKLNTRIITEAELVAVDDASVCIFWKVLFIEWRGYNIENNILLQDNKSAILLEFNGKRSAGKRRQALNIH